MFNEREFDEQRKIPNAAMFLQNNANIPRTGCLHRYT